MISSSCKKIVATNLLIISIISSYGCSNDSKPDKFYINAEINKEEHLCFMKMPLNDDEKYEGKLREYGHGERIIDCEIILPKKFRDKYSMCLLTGITVDGRDHDDQNNLYGWKCDVGTVTNKVTMFMKTTATRGVVLCDMVCIKNK